MGFHVCKVEFYAGQSLVGKIDPQLECILVPVKNNLCPFRLEVLLPKKWNDRYYGFSPGLFSWLLDVKLGELELMLLGPSTAIIPATVATLL